MEDAGSQPTSAAGSTTALDTVDALLRRPTTTIPNRKARTWASTTLHDAESGAALPTDMRNMALVMAA